MNTSTNYCLTIEPYVYISMVKNHALLYNTLDGKTIESDNIEVIKLLHEILQEENCGVTLLKKDQYIKKEINDFIKDIRGKYMGDIIDVSLSNGKPIQILPYIIFSNMRNKRYDFSTLENILHTLSEINIHVDHSTNITKLTSFLQSVPDDLTFNLIGNFAKDNELLFFLNNYSSLKNILCSLDNIKFLESTFKNNFSYKILVHFPVDIQQWNKSKQLLLNQSLPFEYIFNITSLKDCLDAEKLIEQDQIEKYHLNPVYTKDNINFFKEYIFLTKENILSTQMSMKDLFLKQAININDFGKIHIMSNGDIYANVNHPILGDIYTFSIYEIVQKEINEGKSWLRIRNQVPCKSCIYQWLCPSPSDYEIAIGYSNLCHINNFEL